MALGVTAFVVPALLPPLLLLIIPYLKIRELFRRSDRELRRLDSTTRSPIFVSSHLLIIACARFSNMIFELGQCPLIQRDEDFPRLENTVMRLCIVVARLFVAFLRPPLV